MNVLRDDIPAVSDHRRALVDFAIAQDDREVSLEPKAMIGAREREVADAVAETKRLLTDARSIGIAGIEHLTMEAARSAVLLGLKHKARLFLRGDDMPTVRHDTSLAWLDSADLIVGVGNQHLADADMSLEPSLDAVLDMRESLAAEQPNSNQIREADRIAVCIAPDCEPAVISQWHLLAGAYQTKTRIGILCEPLKNDANRRGALEVVAWLTGCGCHRGGADLSTEPIVSCGNLQHHLDRNALDLLINFGSTISCDIPTIQVGAKSDADAISLVVPRIVPGLAARVTRFDGVTFWLCDDPATAPADPTVKLLEQLADEA